MPENTPKTRTVKAVAGVGRWLKVSRYDRASSMLLALLVTVGAAAALLFVVWLSGKMSDPPGQYVGPKLVPPPREGGDGRESGGTQVDTPSEEHVAGKDDKTTTAQEDFEALNTAVTSKAVVMDDLDIPAEKRHGSKGTGGGTGGGDGPGSGGRELPLEPPPKAEPPRNWQVTFASNTLAAYAKQLDFFKIELGILQPDNKIVYLYNLSKSKPDTRVVIDPAANEKRYYLTWRTGEMQQADRELFNRAGIDAGGFVILKFLPKEAENALVKLEQAYAGAAPKRIKLTRFGVQPDGDGFKFYVIEQSLRR
jgi:hypothetical protein